MTDSIRGGGQPLAVRSFVVNKDETSVQEGTGVRGSTPPGKTVEARPGEVPKADRFERASGDAFTGLLNSPATPGMSSTEAGIGVSIAEFLQQGIPSGPASDVGKPATPGPVIVLQDSASTAASGGAGAAGPLGSKPGETGIQGERMRQDLDARFPSTNVGGGEVPPDESGPEVDGGAQDVRDPSAQALAGKGIECGDAVAGGAASGPASGGGGVEAGGADNNRWQANSAIVPDLPAGGELPGGCAGESAGGQSVGTKSQKATVDGNSAGLGPEIPSTGESPGGGSSVSDGWQDTRDADRRAGAEGSIETPPGGDNGGSAGGAVGEQEAWEAVSSFFDSGRDHSTTTGGGESQSGGGGVEAGGADDNRWQANSAIVPDLPAGEELPGGRAGEGGPAVGSMSQNAFVDGNSAGLGPEIPGTGESPEGGSSVSDGMQETGNLDRGAGAGGVETPRSGGGSGGGSEGVDGDGESTSSAGGSAEGTEPQPVEQATDAEDPPEADAVEGDGQSGAPKGYEYRTGPMAHEIGTTVGARFGGEPGSDEFGQQAGQVRVTTGGVGGASGEPNQQMDTGHFEETSAGGSTTIDPLDDPNALRRQHSDPAGEQAQQAAGGGGEQ